MFFHNQLVAVTLRMRPTGAQAPLHAPPALRTSSPAACGNVILDRRGVPKIGAGFTDHYIAAMFEPRGSVGATRSLYAKDVK